MSDLILPGGLDPKNADIILPDGTIHPVVPKEPAPPTRWEILQSEVSFSGPVLEQMRRADKRAVIATLVEALALAHLSVVWP